MTSTSKARKLTKRLNHLDDLPLEEDFEDRITNLPSSVKSKILSHLPTKDAVMTSTLSRKWKRSWTSVTNLDFDDNMFRYFYDGDDDKKSPEDFASFVNRVLLLHDRSCLEKFRLKCSQSFEASLVNTWISAVLHCNVLELDISVPIKKPGFLPSDIFICKSLVVLKLNVRGYVNMPNSVCLPRLKILHLTRVELYNDVSITSLMSGCPVLEELRLSRCISKDVRVINITAPALTSLTFRYLPYDEEEPGPNDRYSIMLDTPALGYLNVCDLAADGYAINYLHNLIKAEISIGNDRIDLVKQSKAITSFFNGISRVQSLVLSRESMEAIYLCDATLPMFGKLKYLEINTTCRIGWDHLPNLLENSPRLETLHLRQASRFENHGNYDFCPVDDIPPSCLLSHLKVIKIEEFRGLEDEMKLVEYFLANAKVLKKLAIYPCDGTKEDATLFKQISVMKRSSTICKVKFYLSSFEITQAPF